MNRLTLAIYRDDHDAVEVTAAVEAQGFCGSGSAWFVVENLAAFCARLREYPIDPTSPVKIEGGYCDPGGVKRPVERHIAIAVAPHDATGRLCVDVYLSMPDWTKTRRSVSTSFIVGYNDLNLFQTGLGKLLNVRAGEAVLTSTLD